MEIQEGRPYPLGNHVDSRGANFSIYSKHATRIDLCLFDSPESATESICLPLPGRAGYVWHGYVPNVQVGQLYGYRVHGPWNPKVGARFNANKVVLDPYARVVGRNIVWSDKLFGHVTGKSPDHLVMDTRDGAEFAPLGMVSRPTFRWGRDVRPHTPWNKTVIYETHVKGLTQLNTNIPEHMRGTYAGLASKPVIKHLQNLGITAVELLPVHQKVNDYHLVKDDKVNYWGYNTLSFFSVEPSYAAADTPDRAVDEFKSMVKTLHRAGIEVILDVVFNHTGEGSQEGPTLSLRGIDNASYYRINHDDLGCYWDYTGCGNTLDMTCPQVLQLIMDSLRYWVQEMHVDGFRFDLCSALAREEGPVELGCAFFDIIHQDPVLSQVKLIAEPWDIGSDGYFVGGFPAPWSEWNGRYRDHVRRFWKGAGGMAPEFARRITGSNDLYEHDGRRPTASINFVTSHDGFSMHDLVSYNNKHNMANGEQNRDGDSHNESWNCGHEGPTDDKSVNAIRERQVRNFLTTLFLSKGVPMLRAGDEIGHTQDGNNNAYCQDSELSWLKWEWSAEEKSRLKFTQELTKIRREFPVFQRNAFFRDGEVLWRQPDGREISQDEWSGLTAFSAVFRAVAKIRPEEDVLQRNTLLLQVNPSSSEVEFKTPKHSKRTRWEVLLSSIDRRVKSQWEEGEIYLQQAHSMSLFVLHSQESQVASVPD